MARGLGFSGWLQLEENDSGREKTLAEKERIKQLKSVLFVFKRLVDKLRKMVF